MLFYVPSLNKFKIDLIFGHMEVDHRHMLVLSLAKSLKRILMTQTWQQHVQHLLFRQIFCGSDTTCKSSYIPAAWYRTGFG